MRRALLALLACCHHDAHPAERIAVAQPGELTDRVLMTGSLHAISAIDLGLPLAQGQYPIRWLIEDGTVVRAGDRVVEFDASELMGALADSRTALAAAESDLVRSRQSQSKGVADSKRSIRSVEIERYKAKLQVDLPPDLLAVRTVQQNRLTLDQQENNLAAAQRALATSLATTGLEDRVSTIALDQMRRSIHGAEAAIASLVVKAPRDGVAVVDENPPVQVKFRVGDKVWNDVPIVTLPDLTKPIEVRADLIDVDDGRVARGMTGTCTLDAYPADPIPCTVDALTPVASPKEDQDSLRRTFSVTLTVEHRDPAHLRPGMSVKVELHRQPLHALVIPRGALIAREHVWLASGELRAVAVAACDAQQCAIASGLAEGDRVSLGAP